MFVKKLLAGFAVVGALALLPAAASAHDYYHPHCYRPIYYPTYYQPVVVAPAPVVVAPVFSVPIDVFYRASPYQPWTLYGTYMARYDADRASHRLEDRGYSVMIQNR